jgi:hypothetical protein
VSNRPVASEPVLAQCLPLIRKQSGSGLGNLKLLDLAGDRRVVSLRHTDAPARSASRLRARDREYQTEADEEAEDAETAILAIGRACECRVVIPGAATQLSTVVGAVGIRLEQAAPPATPWGRGWQRFWRLIPLDARTVRAIADAVEPLPFVRLYDGWTAVTGDGKEAFAALPTATLRT